MINIVVLFPRFPDLYKKKYGIFFLPGESKFRCELCCPLLLPLFNMLRGSKPGGGCFLRPGGPPAVELEAEFIWLGRPPTLPAIEVC